MNGTNCYFIRNTMDLDIFKGMVKKSRIGSDFLAVLWEQQWAPFFDEKGIKYVILNDYAKNIDYGHLRKGTSDLIKAFPHKKILNGKSLIELLEYGSFSLWWFIRQGFFTHCFESLKEIYTIRSLLKNRKIRNVVILNQDEQFIGVIKEAAKNINITLSSIKPNFLAEKKLFLKNKKESFLNNFPRSIRIIQGFFRHHHAKHKSARWNILLFTRSHVRSALGGNIMGDINSYTIMKDLSKSADYNLIQLDAALTREGAWRGIKDKKALFIPHDYFIFRSYFDANIKTILRMERLRLRKLWKKLDKEIKLKEALKFDKVSLYGVLRHQLKLYFFNEFDSFIGAIRNFEIGKKILDECKVGMLIAVDENGSSRFLVFAAKSKKIPSIGLQHGVISPALQSIAYNYSKNDLYQYQNNLNCQLTDRTAVFGNYFRNLLVKEGNYSADRIAVTGQPRLDIVSKNKKIDLKKHYYKKFKIREGKKLVVFASQPRKGEWKLTFSAVIKALKQMENAVLIVKLHPKEEPSPYEKILQELKYRAIISKDIDLYEIILCSDLVIAMQSTAILEALALERPVIQLNLMEKYDVFGKGAKKVIKLVDKEHQLVNAIKASLYDKPYIRDFRKKVKKFISEYFYKIDGKSTERFIKVLEGMLRGK